MASLTETEIAVLREAASAAGYPHQKPRARAARLYALGFIECGAVRWRATHAGHIVLALLDQVAELTREREEARDRGIATHRLFAAIGHMLAEGVPSEMTRRRATSMAADLQELREAAEEYFGGDFCAPQPSPTEEKAQRWGQFAGSTRSLCKRPTYAKPDPERR